MLSLNLKKRKCNASEVVITGILKRNLFTARLSHVEHLFIGGNLTIVKRCGLIKSLWMPLIFVTGRYKR